jgi:hypothetical protein
LLKITKQVSEKFSIFKEKGNIFDSPPPKGGGLLRLSRAFSATLTGGFEMGTVRMGAEGGRY